MTRLLSWLASNGAATFPASLALGLMVPPVAGLLRPFLSLIVLVMTFFIMLRIDFQAALADLRRPAALVAAVSTTLLASPPIAWAAGALPGIPPGIAAAMVVTACAPSITSAPAFARIMGLDPAFALSVSVAGMIASPFTAPPLALSLAGLDLALTLPGMMARLLAFVGLPLLAALAAHRAAPAFLASHTRETDGLTVLSLCVFATGVMDGVSGLALEAPLHAATMLAAAFLLNALLFAFGALMFLPAGIERRLTAGLLIGNRQMALMLAVLPESAPRDVTLFLAIAQLPLYLNPFLLKPLLRRFLPAPARR